MSLILYQHPKIIEYTADLILKANLEAEWDEFIATGQRPEDIFARQMRVWFRQQSDEAVNALHGNKSLVQKYRAEQMIDFQRYQILYEEFEQMMFLGSDTYIEVTGKEIPEGLIKYVPKVGIIEKQGAIELGRLGLGISFDVLNPRVLDFVRTYAFRFSWEITSETNKKLSELLTYSFEHGYSIDKTEKNIRGMFGWMTKNRSRMIARTEVKRAQGAGAQEAYEQSGVIEEKRWYTARDERVCPLCLSLHGKVINLKDNYFNQGESITLMAEGKPKKYTFNYGEIKFPPSHPNCRCRIVAVVEI